MNLATTVYTKALYTRETKRAVPSNPIGFKAWIKWAR